MCTQYAVSQHRFRWLVLGIISVLAGTILCPDWAEAQPTAPPDTLYPVVRTVPPGIYDGNDETWALAQDARGLLYVAIQRSIRQFDGVRWRRFAFPDGSPVRSLAPGPDSTIFMGGVGTAAQLRPDAQGTFAVHPLRHAVPDSLREAPTSFDVHTSSTHALVQTGPLLWTVRDDSLHAVASNIRIRSVHTSTSERGHAVVQRASDGALLSVATDTQSDTAPTVLHADPVLQEATVHAVLPTNEATLSASAWIVASNGLFRLDADGTLTRRTTAADALLQRTGINDAVRLSDGTLAMATTTQGIVIIDPNTGGAHVVNDASGLPSNDIRALLVSQQEALWAATAVGITRINWPGAWTRIPSLAEKAPARTLTSRGDTLYMGTAQGLWRYTGGAPTRVRGVPRVQVYESLAVESDVLLTTAAGVYAVRGATARRISPWSGYGLAASATDPNTAYVGLQDGGVGRVQRVQGQWQARGTMQHDTKGLAYTVAEDAHNALWLGTGASIYRVENAFERRVDPVVTRYDTTHGLPAASFNFAVPVGDAVRFITQEGLYRFQPDAKRFVPDADFAAVYTDSTLLGWPVVAPNAREVWMDFGGYKFGVATRPDLDSAYTWTARSFRRLADIGDVHTIAPAGTDAVWIGTSETVMRYDRQRAALPKQPVQALVRGVTAHPTAPTDQQRRVHGGDIDLRAPLRLPYADNTMRLAFGATSFARVQGPLFERDGPLQFRYRLLGFNDDWSEWSTTGHKDYTGLREGTYRFEVQARDLYNRSSTPATLTLVIAPPWYRTWWAYGLWSILALGLVAGAVQWRTLQLRRRQDELEATVAERTAEVRTQKRQLEQQAEELQALDAAKSRFFANLSHEFRTPLTLMLGPVRTLRQKLQSTRALPANTADPQLRLVERNGHRLLRLVNQVLDLARHDAGRLRIQARPISVDAEAERITQAFMPLADEQAIDLRIHTAPTEDAPSEDATHAPVHADPEALEQMLGNLLSNALKFTPEGGTVRVTATHTADAAHISVSDTGPGIPKAMQERLFDRFVQADDTTTRPQEGTGIGLALTRALAEVHGGSVSVESTEGAGSTFTLLLPRGTDHLTDEQRADSPAPRNVVPEPAPRIDWEEPEDPDPENPGSADASTPKRTAPAPNDTTPGMGPPLVLVVDDNADIRTYIRSILTPDFRVVEAATGAEGLRVAHKHLPDVILADVMMPELDGLDMTRKLRDDARTEAVPIIMLTARAEATDEVEGLSAGATDYVAKPFNARVLESRIRGTLAYQQRLRRQLLAEVQPENGSSRWVQEEAEAHSEASSPPSALRRADAVSKGSPSGADVDPSNHTDPSPNTTDASAADASIEAKMRRVIAERLPDPAFNATALAESLAVSRRTLYRRARKADMPTPAALIRTMRLERAATLLRDGAGTVSEVAYAVGYESLAHFSRHFAQHFDQSPTAYTNQ